MWVEYIQSLNANFVIRPPATEQLIRSLELTLNVELPADLKELLSETDGITINRAYNNIEFEESVIFSWAEINWWDSLMPPKYQPENMSNFLLIGGNYGIDFGYEMNAEGKLLHPHIFLCDSDEYTQPRIVFQNLRGYIEAVASGRETF